MFTLLVKRAAELAERLQVARLDRAAARPELDGAQVASAAQSGTPSTSSPSVVIGYAGGTSSTYNFNGTVDPAFTVL